jgi:transforming growth factor-beta-induced protein
MRYYKKNKMKNYTLLSVIAIFLLTFLGCKQEPELPSVLATMEAETNLNRFLDAIDYADLNEVLDGEGSVTVLAPTDAAVDTFLRRGGYSDVTDVPKDLLTQTILYHFQQGSATAILLSETGYYLTPATLSPGNHPLAMLRGEVGGNLLFNNQARFIRTDIFARNGVIHKINTMLALPDVMSMLESDREFSILVECIERADLRGIFTGSNAHTIFAPFNAAFENYFVNKPGVADLDDLTDEQVREIVLAHTLTGNKRLEDFELIFSNEPFDNLLPGGEILISRPQDRVVLNDSIFTTLMDVQTTNGVIHLVDRVIEPF